MALVPSRKFFREWGIGSGEMGRWGEKLMTND
jgi:hypothetical protein